MAEEIGRLTIEELLTVDKAAERIGLTPRQVRHLIDMGELEIIPCGRRIFIDIADLYTTLAAKKTRKVKKAKDTNGNEEGGEIELNE